MVVCLCQGVSEKQVRRAIAQGASCRREVTQTCGAGGVCGGCHRTINEMIRETSARRGAGQVTTSRVTVAPESVPALAGAAA
jgi:bacterioferritin-associated ferredoxin